MIGRLTGRLLEKQAPWLLIDVGGVGYELEAPMTTFYRLPAVGAELTLHTHFVVREDAQLLYGFHQTLDRTLFRSLIKVNGVGPKMALGLLSGMEAEALIQCIQEGDAVTLTKVPGVGRKTADRLIIEMRDRLQGIEVSPALAGAEGGGPVADAISALEALGYRRQDASKAVQSVREDGLASEELIKRALRKLAGRG